MSAATERPIAVRDDPRSSGLRVAVLVGNEISRQGLTAMLRSLPIVGDVEIWEPESIAGRTSPSELAQGPDLLIMGHDELEMTVVAAIARAVGRRGAKVLLFLQRPAEAVLDVTTAITSDGFLIQDELSTDSLARILLTVTRGETYVPAALAGRLLARARAGNGAGEPAPSAQRPNLTPRERQVLALLVEGLSNKQIARRLQISQHGVKRLVSNVLAKLGCRNRTLAVAIAISERILAE